MSKLDKDPFDTTPFASKPLPSLVSWIQFEIRANILDRTRDIFKQVPLRLLGYGFAVGEALRYRLGPVISDPFYLIASGFVFSHCVYRMNQVAQRNEDAWLVIILPKLDRATNVVTAFYDTLIWEALASFCIPTLITHCVCRLGDYFLGFMDESDPIRKWLPVLLGIAILPMIMFPVDEAVERLMENSIRPIYMSPGGVWVKWSFCLYPMSGTESEIIIRTPWTSDTPSALVEWIKSGIRSSFFSPRPDAFKQWPFRFLGYGFAVAEALRFRLSPGIADPFAMIASGFMLAHCTHSVSQVAQRNDDTLLMMLEPKQDTVTSMVSALYDTLVWEALASWFIPTLITHCVCRFTDFVLSTFRDKSDPFRKWVPMLLGIAILPLIMIPVDEAVERSMEK